MDTLSFYELFNIKNINKSNIILSELILGIIYM